MGKKDSHKGDIEKLLQGLYEAEEPEAIASFARRILLRDPENPEALLELADVEENLEKSLAYLERATQRLEKFLKEDPHNLENHVGALLFESLERLGWTYVLEEMGEEAMALAEKTEKIVEEFFPSSLEKPDWIKDIRYVGLILGENYSAILEAVMKDKSLSLFSAYAKAIALIECSRNGLEKTKALWEAFQFDPALPFYLLNFWAPPLDEDASEEELESYSKALLLESSWVTNENRLTFLSIATVYFGYVSHRLPQEMEEEFLEELKETPFFHFLETTREKVLDKLHSTADIHGADMLALEILAQKDLFSSS